MVIYATPNCMRLLCCLLIAPLIGSGQIICICQRSLSCHTVLIVLTVLTVRRYKMINGLKILRLTDYLNGRDAHRINCLILA